MDKSYNCEFLAMTSCLLDSTQLALSNQLLRSFVLDLKRFLAVSGLKAHNGDSFLLSFVLVQNHGILIADPFYEMLRLTLFNTNSHLIILPAVLFISSNSPTTSTLTLTMRTCLVLVFCHRIFHSRILLFAFSLLRNARHGLHAPERRRMFLSERFVSLLCDLHRLSTHGDAEDGGGLDALDTRDLGVRAGEFCAFRFDGCGGPFSHPTRD
ncbi:hypothetical protein BC830DRAFT_1093518 [Chytriomyces sp. MP71]|nr:hypothetical protein BC830DRAFT_1093518 [Chytriomyces sp. MP71]